MGNAQAEIDRRIATFVQELNHLVRQAALEAVSNALGGAGRAVPSAKTAAGAKPAAKGKGGAAQGKAGAAKSSGSGISAEQLLAYIQSKPGQRLEEIGKGLATRTDPLKLIIPQLLDSNKLRKTGQRRGTKYFVV